MARITPATKLKHSQAHLERRGRGLLLLLDRDAEQFADRGFTPERRAVLAALIEAHADFPGDTFYNAARQGARETKGTARKALTLHLRRLRATAKEKFGYSARYRACGISAVARLTDDALYASARVTLLYAAEYADALEEAGYSAAQRAALAAAVATFDGSIDAQTAAIHARAIAAEERLALARRLYERIAEYSNTGQDIWYRVSRARYQQYLMEPEAKRKKA